MSATSIEHSAPAPADRPFLGPRVVAAAFIAQLLATGMNFTLFGVLIIPLSEAFDTTRGRLNMVLSLSFLAMGVFGPLIGRWLDQGHARRIMVGGVVWMGVGLMAASRASELWLFGLIFCAMVGLGSAFSGPGPSSAIVASWYVRKRGVALGFAVAGATLATMIVPPLIALGSGLYGWRTTVACAGIASVLIGVPAYLALVVSKPEDVGQHPDDEPIAETGVPAEPVDSSTLVRDPRLWLLGFGFGFVVTSPVVMSVTLVPFGEDLGFTMQDATYFFTVAAPFSILGKVVFGVLADRIPPRAAVSVLVLGNIGVWAVLATHPSYALFLATGSLFGISIGATGPLQGVFMGRCFGRAAFGRAMGIGGLATVPLVAIAPMISGLLYDATGNYQMVFATEVGLLATGGILLGIVRIPRTDPEMAA